MPSPEQGASTSTQSNGWRNGSGLRRSAWTRRTLPAPLAVTVRRRSSIRRSRRSHATSALPPVINAASAVVLPPGDAQASSTRPPGFEPASSGTSCDASSCTTNRPSSTPVPRSGYPSCTTSASGAKRPGDSFTSVASSRAARSSRVIRRRFARSVSGAAALLNRSQRSVRSNPMRSYQRAASHRGWESVTLKYWSTASRSAGSAGAAGSGSRVRARERVRNTALTKPLALVLPSRLVRLTASSTTAEAGTRVR